MNKKMDIHIPATKTTKAPLNPLNVSRGVLDTAGGLRQRVGSVVSDLNIHILISPASCIFIMLLFQKKKIIEVSSKHLSVKYVILPVNTLQHVTNIFAEGDTRIDRPIGFLGYGKVTSTCAIQIPPDNIQNCYRNLNFKKMSNLRSQPP